MAEPNRATADATVDGQAARAALQLRLRTRGVTDLDVLRALDRIGREHFVPAAQAHLAWRDMALPAAHGGCIPEPWLLGRMASAMSLSGEDRVLEIGTGSGYATAILAQIVAHVVSIERFPDGVLAARARLAALGIVNATCLVADLATLPNDAGRFSRIVVQGCLVGYPPALLRVLAPQGIVVLGRADPERPARRHLARATIGADGRWAEEAICACRLPLFFAG